MALLGTGWDDPQSGAIMALSAGLLGRNFAGGLLGAQNAYTQAKQAQTKAAFDQMQMDMAKEELAMKRMQIQQATAKDAEMRDFWSKMRGGGTAQPATYSPGQLGSGSFGVVANANPMAPAQPQAGARAGGLAGLTPDDVAYAKARLGLDLIEPWKVAKQGFEQKAGTYRVDPVTNRREYVPDPKEGLDVRNGVVGNMPGFLETQAQRTWATKIPEAVINSAGRVNLRTMPDGSQAPVPELTENQTLQDMMRMVFGGPPVPAGGPAPSAAATAPRVPVRGNGAGDPPAGSGIVKPESQTDRMGILQNSLSQARAGLAMPNLNSMDRARLEQDVKDLEGEMAGMQRTGGAPAQRAPSQLGRYGKTTAQEAKDAAIKDATLKVNDSWLKNSYEPVKAAGSSAGELLTNISVARGALRNMGATGWGTETKAAAAGVLSGLGLAPAKVQQFATDSQTFQNAMATNLQTVLNAAKGPQTEGDAERASKTFAQLKNTPQANEFMLDLAQAKAERDSMRAKFYEMALPVARDKGDLTEVEREWIKRQPSVFTMPSMSRWGIK